MGYDISKKMQAVTDARTEAYLSGNQIYMHSIILFGRNKIENMLHLHLN